MNVWVFCHGEEPRDPYYLAALAWQLPRDKRVWSAYDPVGSHDTKTQLLRQLELDVRTFQWSFTEEAQKNGQEPEPYLLPGEEEAYERAEEREDRNAIELARYFGLNI